VERVLGHLREAGASAARMNDQVRIGQLASMRAVCFWWLGEHDRAIAEGDHALAIAQGSGDVQLSALASYQSALPCHDRGDFRLAVDRLKRAAEYLGEERLRDHLGLAGYPAVMCRAWLARCLAELGEFAEGRSYGTVAFSMARQLGQPYSATIADLLLGTLLLRQGHVPDAITVLERSLARSRKWDLPQQVPQISSSLGAAYCLAGRVAQGLSLLGEAVESAASSGIRSEQSLRAIWLVEAQLRAGQRDAAATLAARALELSLQHNERGYRAWCLRLLAEIASQSSSEEAKGRYLESLALAADLGMRPLVAHCHLGLGKLYRGTGQAQEHLVTARTMYRDMGMTYWLGRLEPIDGN
jgi:tetratricopeptide (TPR) repeat protein